MKVQKDDNEEEIDRQWLRIRSLKREQRAAKYVRFM